MPELDQRTSLNVARLVVPASLDAPDAWPFLEMVRIANAGCLTMPGTTTWTSSRGGSSVLAGPDRLDPDRLHRDRDGAILGAVKIMIANEDDVTALEFDL